jgi:cyclopropane-fatty-acyl-phospholipid synthase
MACRGLGVTLSEPQAELARERIREAGLQDDMEVRVADYREIHDGPFDKIVSVGMYEHVGKSERDKYARTVQKLLRPGGLFLNHGIARLHSRPAQRETFISRYIFPGGELHPVADFVTSRQTAGLEVRDIESLREHYPLTLRRWAANLQAHRDQAIASAGLERERAWRLYMLGSAQPSTQARSRSTRRWGPALGRHTASRYNAQRCSVDESAQPASRSWKCHPCGSRPGRIIAVCA